MKKTNNTNNIKKAYIVTGTYYTYPTVYMNKEKAEAVAEKANYHKRMSGSHEIYVVMEMEVEE